MLKPCKKFLEQSYLDVLNRNNDPEQRWTLVLLRSVMLAVPFWCRERVWRRMLLLLRWISEGDKEAKRDAVD